MLRNEFARRSRPTDAQRALLEDQEVAARSRRDAKAKAEMRLKAPAKPRGQSITVAGITFDSRADLARKLGLLTDTVSKRLRPNGSEYGLQLLEDDVRAWADPDYVRSLPPSGTEIISHGHTFRSQQKMAHQLGIGRITLRKWLAPQATDLSRQKLAAAIARWEANDKRPLGEPQ